MGSWCGHRGNFPSTACVQRLMLSKHLLAILYLLAGTALAADQHPVRVLWADLGGLINGKQVTIANKDGSHQSGRVRAVEADAITFEAVRTAAVRRDSVSEIRMTDYAG